MSSILRALKKIESDPRHQEGGGPLDAGFVPLADTGSQKTATTVFMMIIGTGIVCGLVILAGLWLLQASDRTENTAPAAVSAEAAKPAVDAASSPITAVQVPEPDSIAIPQPSASVVAQSGVMPVPAPAAVTDAPIRETPGPATAGRPATGEAAALPVPPAATAQVEENSTIPVLNDPEIKLQAITWSSQPQKRIAVINNRILRQGEMVAGYRLETINQDDVVLSDAGEKWKLLFRIK